MSKNSAHDELVSSSFGGSPHSILRLVGGWGNIGGPGIFMVRIITSGAITSIFTGVTGALISAWMYDTAGLPFLICSCAGFMLGACGFYRDAMRKSALFLDRYPRLLQLHLDASFPGQRFDRWTRDQLRSSNFQSWTLKSMLIVGWLNAIPAIEAGVQTIVDNKEQKIIAAEAEQVDDNGLI